MGFYNTWILPPVLDLVMRRDEMTPFRERIGTAASGRVLDVGIGSGLNLPFYGTNAREICGIDPSPELLRMAEARVETAHQSVKLVEGDSESLPFDDRSFDTAVVTFTLCTIPNAPRALAEIRRVLKPNGHLLFAEHGRAPEPNVARWQDRLTPLWKHIAGGCHLNRKPDDLIRSAGFRVDAIETGYLKGPRAMGFVYEGRASLA